jgi:hypothetical protein
MSEQVGEVIPGLKRFDEKDRRRWTQLGREVLSLTFGPNFRPDLVHWPSTSKLESTRVEIYRSTQHSGAVAIKIEGVGRDIVPIVVGQNPDGRVNVYVLKEGATDDLGERAMKYHELGSAVHLARSIEFAHIIFVDINSVPGESIPGLFQYLKDEVTLGQNNLGNALSKLSYAMYTVKKVGKFVFTTVLKYNPNR